MNEMSDMQVAETILEQLGGRKFIAMTGAKDFIGKPDELQLSLPRNFAKDGINRVRVRLDPSDTYTVIFERVNARRGEYTEVYKTSDIYCDQLRELFEEHTGLRTSLGRVYFKSL